jgi:CBS domain-containing protein
MSVSSILQTKGNTVIAASATDSVHTIAKTLAEHRIGAVLVLSPSRQIEGIISERDIVREIATHGPDILHKPASMIMTRNVKTCTSADSEETLVNLMTSNRIRHLPVVDNGTLQGMISIGDVVKFRMQQIETEAADLKEYIRTAG